MRGKVLGWGEEQQGQTYLSEAIETKPYSGAETLFPLRVPLACEEGESRCDCCFEDAEEEADGDGAGVVFYGGEAGEDDAPHDDVEGGWTKKAN